MKIGIIGSGDVAQSLAKGLLACGHTVMLGTRDTKKKDLDWAKKHHSKRASIGSFAEAADYGEMAILAVAWHAAENVLAIVRPELSGKIVIDLTNPLVFHENDPPELSIGHDISAGELVQQTLADSHVVKTLNIINHRKMVKPKFEQGTPVMFLCGNNDSAKTHVQSLLSELGWQDIVDIGGIEKSRLLEPLCLLWVEYGAVRNTWDHGFSVLTK